MVGAEILFMIHELIGFELIRLVLALVFLFAAFAKSRAPGRFRQTITDAVGLPNAMAAFVAPALILLEWLLALTLLSGTVLVPAAMAAAASLLSVMSIWLVMVLLRGEPVKCSCFGDSSRPISLPDLLRNGLLLAATCSHLCFASSVNLSLPWPDEMLLAGLALILAMVLVEFHEVVMAMLSTVRGAAHES